VSNRKLDLKFQTLLWSVSLNESRCSCPHSSCYGKAKHKNCKMSHIHSLINTFPPVCQPFSILSCDSLQSCVNPSSASDCTHLHSFIFLVMADCLWKWMNCLIVSKIDLPVEEHLKGATGQPLNPSMCRLRHSFTLSLFFAQLSIGYLKKIPTS